MAGGRTIAISVVITNQDDLDELNELIDDLDELAEDHPWLELDDMPERLRKLRGKLDRVVTATLRRKKK